MRVDEKQYPGCEPINKLYPRFMMDRWLAVNVRGGHGEAGLNCSSDIRELGADS